MVVNVWCGEGGTRAVGFLHSPLLGRRGYTSHHLMHAVDWLPTLLAAVPGLHTGLHTDLHTDLHTGLHTDLHTYLQAIDGVSQWAALNTQGQDQPRTNLVYNLKREPAYMAAR